MTNSFVEYLITFLGNPQAFFFFLIYYKQLPSLKDPKAGENCYVESRAVATEKRVEERHCEE